MADLDNSRSASVKSRWRGVGAKLLGKDSPTEETAPQSQDNGLDDFLAPSREKAAARAAPRPKIDISAAQRWPDASDVRKAMSPSVNSAIKGGRVNKKGKILTVAFVRVAPEIIGAGGDECEEPVIEVSKRKTQSEKRIDPPVAAPQDDSVLNITAIPSPPQPPANFQQAGRPRAPIDIFGDRAAIPRRAETSAREMSAALRANLEQRKSPPMPAPPIPAGDGFGFRPKPLTRAPTGLGLVEESGTSRPSFDSEDLSPQSLKKIQSNFSYDPSSPEDEDPTPRIQPGEFSPERDSDRKSSSSFAARMQERIKMRAEEGKAFSQALLRRKLGDDENERPGSAQSASSSELSPPSAQKQQPRFQDEQQIAGSRSPTRATRPDTLRDEPGSSASGDDLDPPTRAGGPPSQPLPPLPSPRSQAPPGHVFTDGRGAFLEATSQPSPRSSPNPQSYRRPPMTGYNSQTNEPAASHLQPSPSPGYPPQPLQQQPPQASQHYQQQQPPYAQAPPSPRFLQQPRQPPQPPSPGLPSNPKQSRPQQTHPIQNTAQQLPPPVSHSLQSQPNQNIPQQITAQSPGHLVAQPDVSRVSAAQPEPVTEQAARPRTDTVTSGTSMSSGGDTALDDFADRVIHMKGIFRLTAEMERPLSDYSPMQILRAAMWWFLRGRIGLEDMFRNRPRDGSTPRQLLLQPHVDLAKTLWIINDVMESHPKLRRYGDAPTSDQSKLARDAGDPAMVEIFELHDIILGNMKALVTSMSRNAAMPPEQALIQGQDQTIWIPYPRFAPDIATLLSGEAFKAPASDGSIRPVNPNLLMPLGDTYHDFCYARMFVKASLATDDAETDRVSLPCVVTILRPRSNFPLKVTIASQNELLNTIIHIDRRAGPTWSDVQWKTKSLSLQIQLPRGFVLNVEFQERDFRQLWSIYDYTSKIERSLLPEPDDEKMAHEIMLRDFQYSNPANPHAFPPERVKHCLVRVFEKIEHVPTGTGLRKYHRGYRLLIVTSPKNKTLSSVSHAVGRKEPLDFEFKADDAAPDASPCLVLYIKDSKATATVLMGFNDPKERNGLFGALTAMNCTKDETVFVQVPLKALSIRQPGAETTEVEGPLDALQWQDVKVINRDPESDNLDIPKTVLSEHLRIVARHAAGSWTDWMNMGNGETQIRLDTTLNADVHISRLPQADVTASIDGKRAQPTIPAALGGVLKTLEATPSVRTMRFQNQQDLHAFVFGITGFNIRFDGIANTFQIARRRMVVPIYKKWEATSVRILILEREKQYQIACFFENFSHAEAMNFQIKQMDVFEKIEKSKLSRDGTWGVKLVDAKFGLPGGKGEGTEGKGPKTRFVCLDFLEYAGEHDDITLGFESKDERDHFSDALPAATQVSRGLTVRRKI